MDDSLTRTDVSATTKDSRSLTEERLLARREGTSYASSGTRSSSSATGTLGIPLFSRPSLPGGTEATLIVDGGGEGDDLEPRAIRMYIAAAAMRTAITNPF